MNDIQKAIADLRDAINRGEGVRSLLLKLTALEQAVGDDLPSRIQAAAEEIAKGVKEQYGIFTDERDVSDITAIIRRHLEVK